MDAKRRVRSAITLTFAGLALVGAGAAATSGCVMQQTAGTRDSGQSRLMDETFAGQNACNPDEHGKPFIIEWDATDMSSFESLAANDMVIVKYEGCKLRVLDECRNDSVRGSQGAYRPPEWTSGSLETIDIHNEGELYAKLPLGQGTLGGRVAGGERFHMEYFVAGTVYATRDAVYEQDLAGVYGCEEATHFVYAYNLGAFALGSVNETNAELGGSLYGYGGGGSRSSGSSAEKKGGDLATCKADDATEVQGCKTPIRLNLRKIRPGENPDAEAMRAPETDASLSAAGQINERLDQGEEANARWDAAVAKATAGDGPGCIAELDAHDKLDPKHKSSDAKGTFSLLRAQCVMLSGKCEAGKNMVRKNQDGLMPPEQVDNFAEGYAILYCQGDSMSDRDKLLQSYNRISRGASQTRETPEFCAEHWRRAFPLVAKVKPKNEDDHGILHIGKALWMDATSCMARAGDCDKAWAIWNEGMPEDIREHIGNRDIFTAEAAEEYSRKLFYDEAKSCKP